MANQVESIYNDLDGMGVGVLRNWNFYPAITAPANSLSVSAGTAVATNAQQIIFANANGFSFGGSTVGNNITVTGSYAPSVGGLSAFVISAGTTNSALSAVSFANSNGVSFGLSNGTITVDFNSAIFRLTANDSQLRFTSQDTQLRFTSADSQLRFTSADSQLRFTSADTQLQFTSANSNFLGTTYTSHTHSQYLNTSQSSLFQQTSQMTNYLGTGAVSDFRFTSADSQLQFTSNNSNFLQSNATSNFRFTSNDTQLQFTSQMSDYLGTGYTTHTHSQYVNTNQTSLYQLVANSTNSLGTAATASFRHTSADSQLRFTSADSQLQFTSANSNFRYTSADSQLQFTSAMSNYQTTGAYLTTQSAQVYSAGNGSSALQTVNFADSNGVTFSLGTQGVYATVKTDYQSSGNYLTTAMQSGASVSFRFTSADSQLRFTSADSQLRFTSADSQLQFTSANSNFLGTAATQSFRFTSADSQLRFTSADSQLQFTSNTSAITSNAVNTSSPRIQGVIGSNTTYTSGSISFRDLNGISFQSTTGQAFQLTHDLQYTSNTSLITSNAFNTSASSNFVLTANSSLFQQTSATSAITSNAVNTSSPRIQGIIGSNTTYTSGSVSFRDLNGISFQSTTGQAFQLTHDLQFTSNTSNITSNALNTSASRVFNIVANTNSTGGGTTSLSSNVSFSAANGISFYTSAGGAIVANFGSANFQYTSNTSAITSNALNTSQSSLFQHTSATSNITSNALNTSASRVFNIIAATNNTAGGTASLSSNVSFSAANGITFYTSAGGAIVASYNSTQFQTTGNYLTTAMASDAGSRFVNTSAGLNLTNISATLNSNSISLSVAAQSAQPVAASAANGSFNFSTLKFVDTNGISFVTSTDGIRGTVATNYQSQGAYLTTAAQSTQTLALSLGGNVATTNSSVISAGGYVLAGGNGLTIQQSNATLSFSVATNYQSQGAYLTTAMQSNAATISNVNISGGTTSSNLSAFKFIDSQGVSWSLDTGSKIYATVKTDYQTSGNYLTTAMVSDAGSRFVNTSAGLNLTNISATFASNSISLSVAAPSAASFNISGGTTSSNLTALKFIDSNGISWSLDTGSKIYGTVKTDYQTSGNYLTTARASNDAIGLNTALTGNGVAWTVNSSGLSLNVPAFLTTGAQSSQTLAFSLGGNTATTNSSVAANGGFILAGGNGVTMQQSNNSISISVATNYQSQGAYLTTAAQSTQTNVFSLSGNIATTNSSVVSAGAYAFAGGNGVTLQMSNNTLSWSVATNYQSQGAYLTTAMASNRGSDFVQANAVFNGTNASGTIASNAISVSVAAPTVLSSWTVSDNATSATVGRLAFTQANGITMSLSTSNNGNHTVFASYNSTQFLGTAATQSFRHTSADSQLIFSSAALNLTNISATLGSAAISLSVAAPSAASVNVSAGTTSSNLTAFKFIDSQGVSWSLDTGSKIYATVKTDYQTSGNYLTTAAQSTQTMALSLGGNVATTNSSVVSAGGYVLAGGNGVTIQQSNATLSLSVATNYQSQGAYLTTADLSQNSSNYFRNWKLTGNTAGTTSSAQGTDFWLAGGNGLTISGSGQTLSFSVATNYQSQGAYLTTAALSQDSSKYAGTGVTTAGGVGLSATLNTAGLSVSIPSWLTTAAQSGNTLAFSLGGNTATTNSSVAASGGFILAGGNGVTMQQSNNSISISVATNYQSQAAYLTTADLSQNSSKYVQNWKLTGNTAGTTSSAQGTDLWFSGGNNLTISGSSNSLVFSVGNYITTARASNDAIGLNTAQSNVTWTVNSSGLSLDARGYAGTGFTSGGTNISMSGTLNTAGLSLSLSVAAPGAAAENNNINLLGANTAGNTTASGSTIGWSGLNLTLSGTNASQVVISAPATSSIVGTGLVSISVNASTISIGVPNPFVSSYANSPVLANSSLLTFNGASVSHAAAFDVPTNLSFAFLRLPALFTTNSTTISTMASATASAQGAIFSTVNAVVYSLGTGASSKSLQSVASASTGYTFSQKISVTNSTQGSYTLGYTGWAETASTGLSTQYSISNTNYSFTTNNFTDFTSARMLDIPFAASLSAGLYWIVLGMSSSSSTAGAAGLAALTNCNVRYSGHYGMSQANVVFGIMGSSNMTSGGLMGAGSFSSAGGATTNSINISAISSISNLALPYFQLLRSA